MESDKNPINIDYFTDVLCVWAWIAQLRLDEIHRQWGKQISVSHRYVDIFGDCYRKIPRQWGDANGFKKFGEHVAASAAKFEHCEVNPAIWTQTRPRSSMPAHLLLKAVAMLSGQESVGAVATRIRRAFFVDALDISNMNVLLELAEEEAIDGASLRETLRDGRAAAGLSTDLRDATDQGVKGSPTWVLNEGRQLLYGNVGYRILNANIEELLKNPGNEASWC